MTSPNDKPVGDGGPLAFLYQGPGRLTVPNYRAPERFPHAERVLVAECPKSPEDGDGQAVRVYEERWPATFYQIEVLAGPNSVGELRPACEIRFGSGQHALVNALVEAITTGMCGIYPAMLAARTQPSQLSDTGRKPE